MRIAIFIFSILLAGCAAKTTGDLEPPAPQLMVRPAKLADPKAGEDLVEKHAALRHQYGQCTARLVGLQRYARTVSASASQ
jgi:hypothetical protein